MRALLLALIVVLAFATGLAVDYWVITPGRVREAEDRARREFAHREGEMADLRRRVERAEAQARMETEQRRIAEEIIREHRLWK